MSISNYPTSLNVCVKTCQLFSIIILRIMLCQNDCQSFFIKLTYQCHCFILSKHNIFFLWQVHLILIINLIDLLAIALVLVPTRELCLQVYEILQKLLHWFHWIVPGYIMGGENRSKEKARLRKGWNHVYSSSLPLIWLYLWSLFSSCSAMKSRKWWGWNYGIKEIFIL